MPLLPRNGPAAQADNRPIPATPPSLDPPIQQTDRQPGMLSLCVYRLCIVYDCMGNRHVLKYCFIKI